MIYAESHVRWARSNGREIKFEFKLQQLSDNVYTAHAFWYPRPILPIGKKLAEARGTTREMCEQFLKTICEQYCGKDAVW